MTTYISLISLTHRGEEDIQHSVDRANAFREEAEKAGARVTGIYWTLGNYDGVLIFEAPDQETATTLMLSLGSKGAVRTQTLTAFDSGKMHSILANVS